MITVEAAAKICHQTNKAYCEALGDNSQPSWEDAPEWQKDSAIQGVKFKLLSPNSTPRDQHENWMAVKKADGWAYGKVKDVARKRHPCMVTYDGLPPEQKAKDSLFHGVLTAILPLIAQPESWPKAHE